MAGFEEVDYDPKTRKYMYKGMEVFKHVFQLEPIKGTAIQCHYGRVTADYTPILLQSMFNLGTSMCNNPSCRSITWTNIIGPRRSSIIPEKYPNFKLSNII